MRIQQKVFRGLLISMAALLAAGCVTTEGKLSGGAAFFVSETDFKDLSVFSGSQDKSDTGWKVFLGFDPGQRERIVFEGSYQQMGEATFDGLFQGVTDTGTIETDVLEVNVGYRYPFTQSFSAGGRVGLAYADISEEEIFGGTPEARSTDETIAYGGLVVRFAPSSNWAILAYYDYFPDVGKQDVTGEGDIGVLGIGAEFRFGGRNSDD
ncbi:MAG: outer membrane beta-barrel protein [Woeseiaceae bacterium]|nr:outer membrane beta-barrel protein [Woeseiaceae bacterium]